jgi:homoserine kinase
LLVAAFALDRGDLLRVATQDRLHQPYRMQACPLLPLLLPLAGESGILGVTLSGAGPAVLLIAAPHADTAEITARILSTAGDPSIEIVQTRIGCGALQSSSV